MLETDAANATFASATGDDWSCGSVTGGFMCEYGSNVASGATAPTLTIALEVPADAAFGPIGTTVSATFKGIDPDSTNNVVTLMTEIDDRLFVDGFDPPAP